MGNNHFIKIIAVIIMLIAFQDVSAQSVTPPAQADKIKGHEQHRSLIAEDSVKWRRDPFGGNTKDEKTQTGRIQTGVKPTTSIIATPDLNLQGIMQADNAFHALINGRVVKTGDKLDGITINEISRYQVTIQGDNKEKIIYDIYQGRIDRGKK